MRRSAHTVRGNSLSPWVLMSNTTAALNGTSQTGPNAFIMPNSNAGTEKTRDPMGHGGMGEVSTRGPTAEVDPGHSCSS